MTEGEAQQAIDQRAVGGLSPVAQRASGTLGGRRVVVKVLTDPEPFWREKFTGKVAAYQSFAASPPPFTIPVIHAADAQAGVLVIDHADRYPPILPSPTVETLLATLGVVRPWTPPQALAQPVFDYPDRLERYRTAGLLMTQRWPH